MIKLWGLGGGENDYGSGSENNIFQTFEGDHLVSEGTEVSIKADLMTHIDDWLGMGQAKIMLNYFLNTLLTVKIMNWYCTAVNGLPHLMAHLK